MDKMLYTAVSGATRIMESQAIRANNLANADTSGFKADLERVQANRVAAMGNSFSTRVLAQTQSSGFSQQSGALNATGRTLDLAIKGEGLFTVMTEMGEAYTRLGTLVPDADGQLTIDGRVVAGIDGPIILPEYRNLFVGDNGLVTILAAEGGIIEEVGQLKLANPDLDFIEKGLDGLFRAKDGQELEPSATVSVVSGYLESSNVNAVTELIASMDLTRQFEIQVKLMKSAEKLAQSGNSLMRNS